MRHSHKSRCKFIKHQTHIVEDEMADVAKKVIPGNSKNIYEIIKDSSLSEADEFRLMQFVKKRKDFL